MSTTTKKVTKKSIPCNVCGSSDFEEVYPDELGDSPPVVDYNFTQETRKIYRTVKCLSCGLIFTNPMPDFQDAYEDNVDEVYLASEKQRRITAAKSVDKILKYKPGGKLLDVGCATGVFLDAAEKHFDVEGIELSRWASELAGTRHKVYNEPLSCLDISERYDVVTLWGVIEHFQDPSREIALIAKALKPGGVLVVYTGNVDALLPRIMGKAWWWFQGMHLYYFSEKTCRQLLGNHGMNVLSCGLHTLYFSIASLGISLNRYRLGKMLGFLFKIPGIKDLKIPVKLSGEMLLFAQKATSPKNT